jgi:hypothetical protein
VDRTLYWTLSPKARKQTKTLRWIGTICMLLGILALMAANTRPYETGWKVYALMGALIPIGLWWDFVSLRVRHVSRYRSEVILPSAALVVSAAPFMWAVFSWLDRGEPRLWTAFRETVILLGFTVPFALGVRAIAREIERSRRELRGAIVAEAGALSGATSSLARRPRRERVKESAVVALRSARGLLGSRASSSYSRLEDHDATVRCLHCFTQLQRTHPTSLRCGYCGEITRKVDLRTHWTRRRSNVRTQRMLRTVGTAFTLLAVTQVFTHSEWLWSGVPWGKTYGTVFYLAILAVWWDFCGLFTHYRTVLRLELLFPVLVFMSGYLRSGLLRWRFEKVTQPIDFDFWGRPIYPPFNGPESPSFLAMALLGVATWWLIQAVLSGRQETISRLREASDARD